MRRRPDYRATKPFLGDLCFPSHSENNRESKAILSQVETAELLTKGGWEHGDGPLDEVDASCPFLCIAVESGVGLYKIGNISNVNTDVIGTVVVSFDGQCIVQVLGSSGVDGEDAFLA